MMIYLKTGLLIKQIKVPKSLKRMDLRHKFYMKKEWSSLKRFWKLN